MMGNESRRWSGARAALLFGLLLAVTGMASAAPRIQQWRTAEGAQVLLIEEHALPMFDVEVSLPAGTAYDPPGHEGLANLVLQNLNDGTDQRDEETLARALADTGAQFTAHADVDRAVLSLRTLSASAQSGPATAVLTEILHAPTFPPAAFERERARSLSELQETLAQPDGLASQALLTRLYPGHGYGRVVSATSLQSLQRSDLQAFWRAQYRAAGAVIALVGDLARPDAEALATRISAALLPGAAPPALPAEPATTGPARIDIAHPAQQAHLLLGLPGIAYGDPDYVALVVANYILGGGGFDSRLTDEIREKRGLVYGVSSQFTPQALPGPFEISLETRRDQAAEALALVLRVLDAFVTQGPTEAELRGARQNLVGGFALRLDSNRKLLGFLGVIGFYHLPLDWMEAYPRAMARLTLADVRSALKRRIHPSELLTVVVGGGPP